MNKTKITIINLKILGELCQGVKLNTRERYFTLDDTTWYQGVYRTWRGDSRQLTYEKINELISDTRELINTYQSTGKTDDNNINNIGDFESYMNDILNNAIKGLRSLMETYNEDKTFISQLCVELEILTNLLNNL